MTRIDLRREASEPESVIVQRCNRSRRRRVGVPPAIEGILASGAYQRAGETTVTITTTIAELTGRPPRTFAEFVREHAASFRG
jgi:hypothetical protein